MELLSVYSLTKSYRTGLWGKKKKRVLDDISFTLHRGEILGLTGASGSGKSTLIRCIMGLIPADCGQILLNGTDLLKLHPYEMQKKKREMQMVFQNPVSALNPRMTIRESMEEPIRIHGLSEQTKEEIPEILEKFRLKKNLLDRYPHQLSGGELQRICLGRLLLLRPQLLLLDEPTSMLDVSVQAQIISILCEIKKEYPISLLFVSHDLSLLKAVCNRIGVMRQGRLVELSPTEELYTHPQDPYTFELLEAFNKF